QKLLREGRLPMLLALRITREILEALQYAHAQGVIHRDIKPANVLLSGGHAVVADFGVSRPIAHGVSDDPAEPGLTMTGDVIGTPSYMSPEQALGHRVVDARSDIFSVGCVMYEMLVGDRPFDTPIPQYTATRKRHGIFASARAARPEMSAALDAVLAKALKAEPEERYASAAAFLLAIANLDEKDSSGWGMLQQPVPGWMRNVAIGALAVVGVVAATWQSGRTPNGQEATPLPTAIASDKSRVAVLPIESSTPDSLMSVVANGFQSDLIDELAQYPALTVISKNGVLQFRGNSASTDSIARVLNVGSVVTGTIKHAGEMVWVTVRLIDGASGVLRKTSTDSGSVRDLLAVRSSVIASVTRSLRTVIGEALKERESRTAQNSEAWELHARALKMQDDASTSNRQRTPAERLATYVTTDSLLVRAAELDKTWPLPLSTQAFFLIQRATAFEFTQVSPSDPKQAAATTPRVLRERALAVVDQALARSPRDAYALSVRGRVLLDLWRTSRPVAPESLRVASERDLKAAVEIRPDLATAWNNLSVLHLMSGASAVAANDARQALQADAFLREAPATLSRRFFSSLVIGKVEEARSLCASGFRLYPESPQFWGCELTILGWTSSEAQSVGQGWQILQSTEMKDTADLLISGWATRRLLVAAIAARAGLKDSARAILRAVRAAPQSQYAPDNVDYGEAYVRAMLQEPALVFPLLEKYLLNNPAWRGQVRESPWFARFKSDPRFIAMTAPTR
ncbi:MAG: protein kinase, partial [Gemmatimonadaceae bacterium]